MKKAIHFTLAILGISLLTACNAQIKNQKTETIKVYGNCDMCEKTIESAAFEKGVATADWDATTKMAIITYDSEKTTSDAVLKRIAYAGYDNEKYLAPDEAYATLAECCRYDRSAKKTALTEEAKEEHAHHQETQQKQDTTIIDTNTAQSVNPLQTVFDTYFELKNALVKSDSKIAAEKAGELVEKVGAADMGKMEEKAHLTWMKLYKKIETNATAISKSSDLEKQRATFVALSEDMITLANDAGLDTPLYQQHCPMYDDGAGADWLSTENAVKNPYYGSQMLSCGKTVKTIK